MRKLIDIIFGFIVGLFPLALTGIFAIFIYNELPNTVGISICLVLAITALWGGTRIFTSIQRTGVIDFFTTINASPDLDNINPTEGSNTKRRTAEELTHAFQQGKQLFNGGTIRVFGNWHGRRYNNYREIRNINYDTSKKIMTISFSENTKLTLNEPQHILESPSVLKIISAKKVQLEFPQKAKNSNKTQKHHETYTKENKKIITESNIQGVKAPYASIGHDAVIIFK